MTTLETEQWLPIPGAPGYSISSAGRVRSEQRRFLRKNGSPFTVRERILKQHRRRGGPLIVHLYNHGHNKVVRPHLLVARLFRDPSE